MGCVKTPNGDTVNDFSSHWADKVLYTQTPTPNYKRYIVGVSGCMYIVGVYFMSTR